MDPQLSAQLLAYVGISDTTSPLSHELADKLDTIVRTSIIFTAHEFLPEEMEDEFVNLLEEEKIDEALTMAETHIPNFQKRCEDRIKSQLDYLTDKIHA